MAGGIVRWLALAGLAAALAGCGRIIPEGRVPPPPISATARSAGLTAGPPVASLTLAANDAGSALRAFRTSCPGLLGRTDASGLTRSADWRPACAAAAQAPDGQAASFFAEWFETVRVGDGKAFVTGYYEPEIAGVRTRQPGFDVPVYGLPTELVRARPGDAPAKADGTMPLGRYDAAGRFVPYYDRAAIEEGALAGRGLEIGWVADPIELFFLQVQGSGRLIAPDGAVLHIGYAGQNGHPYTGIGAVMRERGLIGGEGARYPGSMQGIMAYLRDHPEEGRALMRENRSYVFFREISSDGPIGTLGVPVRAGDTVAADPAFVPLGAPVWLTLDRGEASGLWVAQDTGGAIKGTNRFDTFWGAGEQARSIAGGMTGRGEALVLVPRGTLARLQQSR